MSNKIIKKLGYALINIVLAVSAIFWVVRLSPGDPIEKILGPEAKIEDIQKYRTQLGLDLPMGEQYTNYVKGLVHGDFGTSLFKGKEVITLLSEHFPPTMVLALCSVFLSSIIGTFLGILSGYKKSQMFDGVTRIVSLLALAFPIFSLAPILVLIFSIKLGVLPVSEWGGLRHAVLPILTLTVPLSSVILRVARNKFLEECHGPWVQVLRAKGMSEGAVLWRVTKVCFPTILNVVAIQLSVVLAGTMISETIFDIPGMGSLLFEAIQNRDYPLVQGLITYTTIIYMLVYFVVDFVNQWLDPRISA